MTKEELDAMRLQASQTISSPESEEPQEEVAEEPTEEGAGAVEPDNSSEDTTTDETTVEQDPPRIPYSRFESVNEARIVAEEKLRAFQEAAERERLAQAQATTSSGLPDYWVKLYGDNEASQQAYELRQQELQEIRESLKEGIREDILREQTEYEHHTEGLVESWTEKMDDYAATHKRTFTEAETNELLDVMDELTPKDADGNYVVEPINFLTQAVELRDLRIEKASAAKKASKKATTDLTSASSEGNPLVTPTKEWTGDWRSKLARMGR